MAASKSFISSSGLDCGFTVLIPTDPNQSGNVAERVKRATVWLWSRCIYPTPSAVNLRVRGKTRNNLNGVEVKARDSVLNEKRIPMPRKHNGTYNRRVASWQSNLDCQIVGEG